MFVVPVVTLVTTPVLFTVATGGEEEVQVYDKVPAPVAFGVRASVLPRQTAVWPVAWVIALAVGLVTITGKFADVAEHPFTSVTV